MPSIDSRMFKILRDFDPPEGNGPTIVVRRAESKFRQLRMELNRSEHPIHGTGIQLQMFRRLGRRFVVEHDLQRARPLKIAALQLVIAGVFAEKASALAKRIAPHDGNRLAIVGVQVRQNITWTEELHGVLTGEFNRAEKQDRNAESTQVPNHNVTT